MLRFNNKDIENIEQILDSLPNQYASINVIDLSNNKIKVANLDMFPQYITNVNLQCNLISDINWDDRKWGTISLRDNSIDFEEISNLNCKRLDMSQNIIEDITFMDCEINELILEDNKIKILNFVNCKINKLVISKNKISEITHLPEEIIHLVANKNRIKKVCELPDSILILELGHNLIDSLTNIPINLVKLDLSYNVFTQFDIAKLPKEIMDYFDISHNKVTNNEETFGILKKHIEELYYDDDVQNETKNDNTSNNSINTTSSGTSILTSSNSKSLDKSDSNSDSDSDLSIQVVRNKKIESDDDGSDLEKEFVKINTGTKNMRVSDDSDSDSDDDISKQIRQFTMKKMNEYNTFENVQHIQNNFEQKRFDAYHAALERAKFFEDNNKLTVENTSGYDVFDAKDSTNEVVSSNNVNDGEKQSVPMIILTEEQKEMVDILKQRTLKKNMVFSSRTPVNISWTVYP